MAGEEELANHTRKAYPILVGAVQASLASEQKAAAARREAEEALDAARVKMEEQQMQQQMHQQMQQQSVGVFESQGTGHQMHFGGTQG